MKEYQPKKQQQYYYRVKSKPVLEEEKHDEAPRVKYQIKGTNSQQQFKTQKKRQENSYYNEYMYGSWRKERKKIFVTLETEIPSMPKDLIVQPDEADYQLNQVKYDEKFEKLLERQKELNQDLNHKIDKIKGVQGNEEQTQELKVYYTEIKTNNIQKQEIYNQLNVINDDIRELEQKRDKAKKKVHKTYNKVELIPKGLAELKKYMETTTVGGNKEKEIIQEMKFLENSKSYIEDIQKIDEVLQEKRKEKYQVGQGLGDLKEVSKTLNEEIDKIKKSENKLQLQKGQIQIQIDKIKSEREDIRIELNNLKQKKRAETENFYKNLIDYEKQQQEIRTIEWMRNMKEKLIEKRDRNKNQYY